MDAKSGAALPFRRRLPFSRLQLRARFHEQLLDLLPLGFFVRKPKKSLIVLNIHSQDFDVLRHLSLPARLRKLSMNRQAC